VTANDFCGDVKAQSKARRHVFGFRRAIANVEDPRGCTRRQSNPIVTHRHLGPSGAFAYRDLDRPTVRRVESVCR
jgi:hypothetical protein